MTKIDVKSDSPEIVSIQEFALSNENFLQETNRKIDDMGIASSEELEIYEKEFSSLEDAINVPKKSGFLALFWSFFSKSIQSTSVTAEKVQNLYNHLVSRRGNLAEFPAIYQKVDDSIQKRKAQVEKAVKTLELVENKNEVEEEKLHCLYNILKRYEPLSVAAKSAAINAENILNKMDSKLAEFKATADVALAVKLGISCQNEMLHHTKMINSFNNSTLESLWYDILNGTQAMHKLQEWDDLDKVVQSVVDNCNKAHDMRVDMVKKLAQRNKNTKSINFK